MAISTIRFRGVFAGLRSTRKRYKAIDYLRTHIARFNKSEANLVNIDPKLNAQVMRILSSGDSIKVDISKTGDIIKVKLAEEVAPKSPAGAVTAKLHTVSNAVKSEEKKPDNQASKKPEKITEKPAAKGSGKMESAQNAESNRGKQKVDKPAETKNQG